MREGKLFDRLGMGRHTLSEPTFRRLQRDLNSINAYSRVIGGDGPLKGDPTITSLRDAMLESVHSVIDPLPGVRIERHAGTFALSAEESGKNLMKERLRGVFGRRIRIRAV
jgi:hypothetical protein